MTRVKLEGISKKFGAITALNDVSLSLEAGRSMALIGPTAAGKSVLLKCLVGLYGPDSGTISIDGAPVGTSQQRSNALNKRIGMLFQQNALFDSLPVWENIAFRLIADGMSRDEARQHAEALLPKVGLQAANTDLFPLICRAVCKSVSASPAPLPRSRIFYCSITRPPVLTLFWRPVLMV